MVSRCVVAGGMAGAASNVSVPADLDAANNLTAASAVVAAATSAATAIAAGAAAAGDVAVSSEPHACITPPPTIYDSLLLGIELAVPEWEAALTALVLVAIIVLTIVGNVLVILSVFSYTPLRIVQNFFIVSLAVADLTVALLVLPLNVAYAIRGRWDFGIYMCKIWLTCDVLCCTASILNLCAIALDRYWAITDPINYAQKRTLKRVLLMIAIVWGLSFIICCPPLAGWNNWPDVFELETPCMLTTEKGYVVYSSLGSFFIPLAIMSIVYAEIFVATRRRLRERARASKLNAVRQTVVSASDDGGRLALPDQESVSSETNHNEQQGSVNSSRRDKSKRRAKKSGKKKSSHLLAPPHTPVTPATEDSTRDAGEVLLLPPPLPAPTTGKRSPQVFQFIEEKQRISLSKERRAARTLGIIMGVFILCWLPFFLMYVIVPFCESCCPSAKFVNFITWLGYINSALNPIIYTIFNMDFRRAFKKLLHIKS